MSNIYSDMIEAQSWFMPGSDPGDEISIKNYMETLPDWNNFLFSYKMGDELWYYRFPYEMWRKLSGSHGYVILRNGKYYCYFELAKN
ncbi:MAG: hypothetical protein GY795_46400 [Desulfobacterales bacterium]|nr:hypothetical protein [Desulfobacterales bacterium]